jgi:23S rRNA pseudouridine1911/1915/1917 synthase
VETSTLDVYAREGELMPPFAPDAAPPLAVAILYEDDALLAVNKPAGLVVHPAYKHPNGTLADAVFACQAARGERRPWLLHRLDRDTSGVVLFAKTDEARRALVRQFERRSVRKLYLALASGAPRPPEGVIEASLRRDPADRRRVIVAPEGQTATTAYRTLAARDGAALLAVRPLTGRTHQIRAHLAHAGAPLLGDATYLAAAHISRMFAPRVMLHAVRLEVIRPGAGTPLAVSAPVPDDFHAVLRALGLPTPDAAALSANV